MTVFKRGSVFLTCLFCGDREFDIVKHISTRGKFLRCKRCGFRIKESGYFYPVLRSPPESPDERSYLVARR